MLTAAWRAASISIMCETARFETRDLDTSSAPDQQRESDLLASVEGTVRAIARSFATGLPAHDVEDLQAAGRLGALFAARRYDPSRGANFNTYATWWIRAYVVEELFSIRAKGRCRKGTTTTSVFFGYSRACQEIEARGEPVTVEAVAARLGVSENIVRDAVAVFRGTDARYDEPVSEDQDVRLSDVIPVDQEGTVLDALVSTVDEHQIRALVEQLGDREQHVIVERYFRGRSLVEIGEDLGVGRERARQIEAAALRRLREWFSSI